MMHDKWCRLCLDDSSDQELVNIFSVVDLSAKIMEEYDIHIIQEDSPFNICFTCFQDTLNFRKQRKQYVEERDRILKNQNLLSLHAVPNAQQVESSKLKAGGTSLAKTKPTPKKVSPNGGTTSSSKSKTKNLIKIKMGWKGLSSAHNTSSATSGKNSSKTTDLASNNENKTNAAASIKANETVRVPKDNAATTASHSKEVLDRKKRVRFSIQEDANTDCDSPPGKKGRFSTYIGHAKATPTKEGLLCDKASSVNESRSVQLEAKEKVSAKTPFSQRPDVETVALVTGADVTKSADGLVASQTISLPQSSEPVKHRSSSTKSSNKPSIPKKTIFSNFPTKKQGKTVKHAEGSVDTTTFAATGTTKRPCSEQEYRKTWLTVQSVDTNQVLGKQIVSKNVDTVLQVAPSTNLAAGMSSQAPKSSSCKTIVPGNQIPMGSGQVIAASTNVPVASSDPAPVPNQSSTSVTNASAVSTTDPNANKDENRSTTIQLVDGSGTSSEPLSRNNLAVSSLVTALPSQPAVASVIQPIITATPPITTPVETISTKSPTSSGIKQRRHSTFIRVSTNLFDEQTEQFASIRNNLFITNQSTSLISPFLVQPPPESSSDVAVRQTTVPNNPMQVGVISNGVVPVSPHVSSIASTNLNKNKRPMSQIVKAQPATVPVRPAKQIPTPIVPTPSTNNGLANVPNHTMQSNYTNLNTPGAQQFLVSRPNVVRMSNVAQTPTTTTISATTQSSAPRQPSFSNGNTNSTSFGGSRTSFGGAAVVTINNLTNLPILNAPTVSNGSIPNPSLNSTANTSSAAPSRPVLMCQLCTEFFLSEPLIAAHLNQVHYVEFTPTLYSTVYDESIWYLLVARSRRKSIATPGDFRTQ